MSDSAASTPGGSASRSGGKGERDRLPAQPSSAAYTSDALTTVRRPGTIRVTIIGGDPRGR